MKALRKNRYAVPLFILVIGLLLPLRFALPASAAPGFVTTSGTKFMLDGRPFYVAGTNNHYLGWGTRAEVDSVLNSAAQSDYNVVRGILHSVIGSLDGTTKPHVWNPNSTADASNMGMHGTYLIYWDTARNTYAFNDSATNGLGRWDYVIAKAGQLGIKLDIAMLDFWQWAGGTQQVNSWYIPNYNPSGDAQRYTFFYSDSRTKQFYKDWASHVLNRVNSITGVRYKDDPTIFAWDLMNEPEISSVPLAQGWYQEMASHIKTQGARQLVTTGSEGFYGGQAGSDPDTEPANVPAVDFQTWHTYPTYHGITPQAVVDLVNRHCASAKRAGKPVVMQEFAYPARSAVERQTRSDIYKSWLQAIYNNDDCAGWVYWRLEGKLVPPPTRPHPQDDSVTPSIYPPDNGEGFSVNGDTDVAYQMFKTEAARLRAKGTGGPSPTGSPTVPPTQPPPATGTIDDSNVAWSYAGGWQHCTNCNESGASYYNASQSWSSATGDTATLRFTGTRIGYYAVRAPHHGIAAVSVDGGAEVLVDLYATAKAGDALVWTSPQLASGTHTLRIRNTGTRNSAASGTVVTVDRADTATQPPPATTFVKGINVNGGAVTIEGNAWLSYTQALGQGFSQSGGATDTKSLTPTPATDAATTSMLNTLLYATTDPGTITLNQTVANGGYQVYVWVMENFQAHSRRFNVNLEGTQVATGVGDLGLNEWRKYGPYTAAVTDGSVTVNLVGVAGRPMVMGMAIYR
jgi:mannan endo-1,4-beta-mannosidase